MMMYMEEDRLAGREIEAIENLIKRNQQIELIENLEDDAEYERSGWAGWNGWFARLLSEPFEQKRSVRCAQSFGMALREKEKDTS
jgi:hypothetical protein